MGTVVVRSSQRDKRHLDRLALQSHLESRPRFHSRHQHLDCDLRILLARDAIRALGEVMKRVQEYWNSAQFEKGIDEMRGLRWFLESWQMVEHADSDSGYVIVAVFRGGA